MIRNKILVLDDEVEICNILTEFLEGNNYLIRSCTRVEQFMSALTEFDPQFLLIDKNVNQVETYQLIDTIRKTTDKKDIPIIVLTGACENGEQERAVDIGADDIIFKPLHLPELRAKLKSLARRSNLYMSEMPMLDYKGIRLQLGSNEAFIGEQRIELTSTEFKILKSLLLSKGSVLSREQLNHKALTVRNNSPRTIDVHMNSLRNKLGELGNNIKTLRGRGYCLIA